MFGFVVSAATNCGVILITSIDDFSKENPVAEPTDCLPPTDRPTCSVSAMGHLADVAALFGDVRCPPNSRHRAAASSMSAKCHS